MKGQRLNDTIGWSRIVAPIWNDKKPHRHTFHSKQVYFAYEQMQKECLKNKSSIIPLEKYVMDLGFVRHAMNHKTHEWEPTDNYCYSTMGDLIYSYQHTDGRIVNFGLNQRNHPPGLTYPRPRILAKMMIDGGIKEVYSEALDSCMERITRDHSSEEIFKAMFDNSIVFKVDMTDTDPFK